MVHDLEGAVAVYREAGELVQDNPRKTARLYRLTGNAWQKDRAGSLADLAAAEAALDQTAWRDDAELMREWIDTQLNTLNVHYWSGDGEARSQLAAGLAQNVGNMTAEQRAEYFVNWCFVTSECRVLIRPRTRYQPHRTMCLRLRKLVTSP